MSPYFGWGVLELWLVALTWTVSGHYQSETSRSLSHMMAAAHLRPQACRVCQFCQVCIILQALYGHWRRIALAKESQRHSGYFLSSEHPLACKGTSLYSEVSDCCLELWSRLHCRMCVWSKLKMMKFLTFRQKSAYLAQLLAGKWFWAMAICCAYCLKRLG